MAVPALKCGHHLLRRASLPNGERTEGCVPGWTTGSLLRHVRTRLRPPSGQVVRLHSRTWGARSGRGFATGCCAVRYDSANLYSPSRFRPNTDPIHVNSDIIPH